MIRIVATTKVKTWILVLLISGYSTLSAQTFQLKNDVDTLLLTPLMPLAGDITQDGCLELIANTVLPDGTQAMTFIINKENFEFDTLTIPLERNYNNAFHSINIDHDVDLDLFTIGNSPFDDSYAIGFLNQGDSTFIIDTLGFVANKLSNISFADFDNDGSKELLAIIDDKNLSMLDLSLNNPVDLIPDYFPHLQIIGFKIADYNNDSWIDVFVSAMLPDSSFQSGILYNQDSLGFNYNALLNFEVSFEGITKGDIDQNGYDDLLLVGKDALGLPSSGLLMNFGTSLNMVPITLPQVNNGTYFMADFTSDGQTDISITGNDNSQHDRHYLLKMDPAVSEGFSLQQIDTLQLDTLGYISTVADWDVDGDLDLAFWNRHNGRLQFYENTTSTINNSPNATINPVVFMGNEEIVVVWEETADDHTTTNAITYDLSLHRLPGNQLVSGGFNVSTGDRLYPDYGYFGHNEVAFIKKPPIGNYTLVIQSIDNALYVGGKGSAGDCTLSFEVCESNNIQNVYVCDDNPLQLNFDEATDPGTPAWYSLNQGFLAYHDVLEYQLEGDSDVVYVGIPGSTICDFKTIKIEKVDLELPNLFVDTLLCENESLQINLTANYDSVFWESPDLEIIATGSVFNFSPTGQSRDTIIYRVYQQSCEFKDTLLVGISTPEVTASPKSSIINSSESVQLNASGTLNYTWMPPTWLDVPDIGNPVAQPIQSVEYIVVGTDNFGCEDADTVNIEVVNVSFAPNLFTPNQDGSNETFKLLNLGNPDIFNFIIFDRNGKKMYETNDAMKAGSVGWDGTKNGNPAPQGVYFWRVSGIYLNGKPILINGKTEGTINLLR